VGVVGAIATNLGATSTDRKLDLAGWERSLMFVSFLIMAGIEVSLFVDKPHARVFAITILAIGLFFRGFAIERSTRKKADKPLPASPEVAVRTSSLTQEGVPGNEPLLCAVRGIGKTLDFAIEEAKDGNRPLYVLFVREQAVITPEDGQRKWNQDEEALGIFDYVRSKASALTFIPCYAVSDSAADTIVDLAATLGVSRLLLGSPQRRTLINILRGDIIRQVSNLLPENIHLLVYA
jgi:hypothetical protein